jgi:uncharacterized protein YuzE
MESKEIRQIMTLVPGLLKLPQKSLWTTYDKEADVLYINFKKPSHTDDSEMTKDDIIIRYEKGKIVGVTILNAARKFQKH